jgi:hypothetical protein
MKSTFFTISANDGRKAGSGFMHRDASIANARCTTGMRSTPPLVVLLCVMLLWMLIAVASGAELPVVLLLPPLQCS